MKAAIAWLKAHHVWHTWGKWQLYSYADGEVAKMNIDVAGQYRVCEVCERRQSRDV